MLIRKLGLVMATAAVLLSLSCTTLAGVMDASADPVSPGKPRFAGQDCTDPQASGFSQWKDAFWPDSIPSEIPPLRENITTVFEPDYGARIFYAGVSADQVNNYLDVLEQQGFELQPIVYVREGFPDNSEEKIRKGDIDAIDASKGNYQIRIEFGCDSMDMVIQW